MSLQFCRHGNIQPGPCSQCEPDELARLRAREKALAEAWTRYRRHFSHSPHCVGSVDCTCGADNLTRLMNELGGEA